MSDLCVFLGGFAVEVGVVRRGGAPLPGLRGQPGGETFFFGNRSKVPSLVLLVGRLVI